MKICFSLFVTFELIHIIRCSSSEEREAAEESAFGEKAKRMLVGKEHKIIHSKITLILDKDSLNKEQASDKCKNLGGSLVSLTSVKKTNVLESIYGTSYEAWTSAIKKNDIWKWGTGELLRPAVKRTWTHSATSQSDFTAMIYPHYVENYGYELWAANPATESYVMACEVDGKKKVDRANLGTRTLMFMQSTFIFVRSYGINFTTARSECDKFKPGSAHLAAPTSFKELELIDKAMNETASNNYWLGAKRNYYSDKDKWLNGDPIATNLRKRTKDNGGRCLIYKYKEQMFDWANCSGNDRVFPMGFICQIDKDVENLFNIWN